MCRIALFGDPHGNFRPVSEAVKASPDVAIFLGDFDLERPLEEEVSALTNQGADIAYIHGNHDTDRDHWHDYLFHSSLASGNFSGKVIEYGGVKIAGLGGVFRQAIWHPKDGEGTPRYQTREMFMAANPRSSWRGGLPRTHRSTIFPEDIDGLADQQADILITHEAPSSHRYGFEEIDLLAEIMGVRLIIHGHHHERIIGRLKSGINVLGLDRADLVIADLEEMMQPEWVENLANGVP